MVAETSASGPAVRLREGWPGYLGLVVLVALTASVAVVDPVPKLLGISWVAFAAMVACALLGARTSTDHPRGLVWGYGLASGAMLTSAAVFLVPPAIGHHPEVGGFGVALGLLVGFGAHTAGHRLTHLDLPLDHTTAAIAAHALAAGSIIGVVYVSMPELGPLLGLAIVSHKGPAGYAAARRLTRQGLPAVALLLLPASGVGITALSASLLSPTFSPVARAAIFGFAAGIFLHVAMDFLPRCELGDEIHELVGGGSGEDHALLDRLRSHAVASTGLGALAVFVAWLVIA